MEWDGVMGKKGAFEVRNNLAPAVDVSALGEESLHFGYLAALAGFTERRVHRFILSPEPKVI